MEFGEDGSVLPMILMSQKKRDIKMDKSRLEPFLQLG
jgi:hypothetical protein